MGVREVFRMGYKCCEGISHVDHKKISGVDPDILVPALRYNVKIIEYKHGTQIRIYKRNLEKKGMDTKKKKKRIDPDNPFFENCQIVDDFTVKDKNISIMKSVSRTKSKIYSIARSNDWEYFFTLTLDPRKIDRKDYNIISKKLVQWFHDVKKYKAPDLKYLLIPELHKDGVSYHFHGLMSNLGGMKLKKSGKKYKNKYGDIVEIYNPKGKSFRL